MKLLHAVFEGIHAAREFATELVIVGAATVMLFIGIDLIGDMDDADSWHGEDR